jgi:hypothetical protein
VRIGDMARWAVRCKSIRGSVVALRLNSELRIGDVVESFALSLSQQIGLSQKFGP